MKAAVWNADRGRWECRVQQDGKRRTFTSTAMGRRGRDEAERKAAAWIAGDEAEDPVFSDAWARYLRRVRRETGTDNAFKTESIGRNWLLPSLHGVRLSRIKPAQLQSILDSAVDAGRSKRTCGNIRSVITSFSRWTEDYGMTMCSVDRLSVSRKAPVGERKILQPAQVRQLLTDEDAGWYGNAFKLLVLTGLRRGELAALEWDDISADGVVHITKSVNHLREITPGKTKNARRVVQLTPAAMAVLDSQREQLREHLFEGQLVFPTIISGEANGNAIYKAWQRYCEKRGISCSLHELRHTYISLVQYDMPAELLKAQVGHSKSMDSTAVYGHAVAGAAQRAAGITKGVFDKILNEE